VYDACTGSKKGQRILALKWIDKDRKASVLVVGIGALQMDVFQSPQRLGVMLEVAELRSDRGEESGTT
jgi:hypothetical protein